MKPRIVIATAAMLLLAGQCSAGEWSRPDSALVGLMRGSVAAEARAKKAGMSKAQKAVLYGCVAGALVGGLMWSDAIQEQIDAIEKYGDHAPKYLGKQKTGVLVVTFSAALGFLAAVH